MRRARQSDASILLSQDNPESEDVRDLLTFRGEGKAKRRAIEVFE
jgi:hypothetical protein